MADQSDSPNNKDGPILDRLIGVMWIGIGIALIALLMANATDLVAAAGIGVIIFLTAFASGCLLGFLFGVPRAVAEQNSSTAPQNPAPSTQQPLTATSTSPPPTGATTPTYQTQQGGSSAVQNRILQSNTNLERISDWLTTLLVGAGLVQLSKINDLLSSFRIFMETSAKVFVDRAGVHTAGALPTVCTFVVIFGLVCGFLFMYLNTRLVLIRLFFTIERMLTGDEKLGGQARREVQNIIRKGEGLSEFLQNQITRRRALTVEDAIQLMLSLLYKDNPSSVIDIGARLSDTDAANRPEYWYYLAAAFGQKLSKIERQNHEDDWFSARDNALDCAQRAVALNPGYRELLWSISDPAAADNDLAELRDDRTFCRIVGRPLQ